MNALRILLIGASIIAVSGSRASKIKTPFPYVLQEAHHAVAGRVNFDAHRGSRVKAIPEKHQSESEHGSHVTEGEGQFLRVVKKLAESGKQAATPVRFDVTGMTRKPTHSRLTSQDVQPSEATIVEALQTGSPSSMIHIIHKRSTGSDITSDHMTRSNHWHKVEGIVHHRPRPLSNSIPPFIETTADNSVNRVDHMTANMADDETLFREVEENGDNEDEILLYAVMETDLFYVDAEDYVAVANSTTFRDYDAIEFYVYLSNEQGDVLSTPLAFIIYIDQPGEASDDYPAAPAIFAGVLVLFIVFLALFIPFVTRAKRRYKQGKPVFKMGSHPSMTDLDTSAVISRVETREPNWYGNNTLFSYEEEVEKEKDEFTSGIKRLSKKGVEPPTLQLHKKVKAPSSSSSSVSEATNSTQDDTKYETQRL